MGDGRGGRRHLTKTDHTLLPSNESTNKTRKTPLHGTMKKIHHTAHSSPRDGVRRRRPPSAPPVWVTCDSSWAVYFFIAWISVSFWLSCEGRGPTVCGIQPDDAEERVWDCSQAQEKTRLGVSKPFGIAHESLRGRAIATPLQSTIFKVRVHSDFGEKMVQNKSVATQMYMQTWVRMEEISLSRSSTAGFFQAKKRKGKRFQRGSGVAFYGKGNSGKKKPVSHSRKKSQWNTPAGISVSGKHPARRASSGAARRTRRYTVRSAQR